MPGTIPELVWGVGKDETGISTLGCLDCLYGGLDTSSGRMYFISGSTFCAQHAKVRLDAKVRAAEAAREAATP